MKRLLTLTNLAWALAYLALMAVLVWQLGTIRANILASLSTPSAQAEWDKWRAEAVKPGPVARRQPKSAEPPALVLLRDYYGVCLAAALFFSSLLFVVMMLFARGAMVGRSKGPLGGEN